MKGEDLSGHEAIFQKPWFITFIMFVAMAISLLFDKSMWRKRNSLQDSLIDSCPQRAPDATVLTWGQKVRMVAYPAVFDILATGLCSMGFLYIPASVWQLLRGAEMVFSAIFAVVFLRRKFLIFHWLGVVLCTVGIILVGLASVWGSESQPTNANASSQEENVNLMLLGMALALGGQVVQAAQVIAEEYLLKEVDLPGLQIVGFEGVWGGLIMLVIVFPLLLWLPGADHGHLEDEREAWSMVTSNPTLFSVIVVYTFSCATYNISGIAVTGALSAVHRVMLEAFRTSIVWIFGLSVHYFYDSRSKFGEAWTPWSWLEVCGFLVLMLGQAVYGEMLQLPCFTYPPGTLDAVRMASPGQLRNLASPLPPVRHVPDPKLCVSPVATRASVAA
eukprot:SRR837773.7243.p2 GENE.SRR837773.7243~~SRR837773.7243.p2  ORF type:complete len:434 (+),score=171.34 SRR837773.7243:138-1304(+)